MATTLTSSYKYIGRSNAVGCDNGYNYYILLYAKTSANKTTGKHTVYSKLYLACTSDSTFHNWNTTGYVRAYTSDSSYSTVFSWSNAKVPLSSWSSSASLTVGSTTYKRHVLLKEDSVEIDTKFLEKTITLKALWRMEETYSAGWFPDNTDAKISASVVLSAIATASTPTLSDSTPQMGQTVQISTNRVSSALTHTLTYAFGTKTGTIASSVGASCSWTIPDLAAYCDNASSGTLKITCKTYSGSTLIGTKSASFTLSVQDPTTPTLSANSIDLGSSVTIKTPRKSSNFTHKLTYSFGGTTGTIASSGVTTSKAWTPSYDLAKKIPSATSGECTITCTTYNGTKSLGSKTVKLTLKVPDNETTKPTFTYTLAPTPNDVVASNFADRLSLAGKYVKMKSRVVATFDASSAYSTVAEYSMKVDGVTKSSDDASITSDYIKNYYGTLTVTLRVTDARGYYTEVKDYIRVLNWVKPYMDRVGTNDTVVCERQAVNTAEDNTVDYDYLRLAVKRVYTPMEGENLLTESGFTQGNLCTMRYRYKKVKEDEDSYSPWVNLIYSSDISTDEYVGLALDADGNPIQLKKAESYDVHLRIYDMTDSGTPQFHVVPTEEATLHLKAGGKGVGLGVYCEEDESVTINPDWNVYGRVAGLGKCKEEIPSGADLNNYRTIGEYSVPNNTRAETLLNCPSDKAGRLKVYSGTGDGRSEADGLAYTYLLQEYTTFNGNYRYRRMVYTGATADEWSYGEWKDDNVATGLVDTLIHNETSYTPTATGAQDVYSTTLQPGVYIWNITVTWSKINTATELMIRNSFNKVPSKVYGKYATSSVTPGIQSTDLIRITTETTVATQIWAVDSTSLKAYTVHTKIFKLA